MNEEVTASGEEGLEQVVFKTLSHQKRRDIVRFVGERGKATFTEIKNSVGADDSATLAYHLNALGPLIAQKGGSYALTDIGGDAYNLIYKVTTYSLSTSLLSSLRRRIPLVIIANAVLWASAIFSVSVNEGPLKMMTLMSFSSLWFISNIILYSILKNLNG